MPPITANFAARPNERLLIGAILLAAGVVISHAPLANFDFVYDDHRTVIQNSFAAHPRNIWNLLSGQAFAHKVIDAERPLMVISTMLDRFLFGLKPTGHHLHSAGLHLVNTLLVSWLLLRITRRYRTAWFGGLIFGILPAHAEAVAVVSYREDLLAAGLIVSALLALTATRPNYVLSGIFAFLAFWSKESALALLALWPGLAWLTNRNIWPNKTHKDRWVFFYGQAAIILGLALALTLRFFWAGEISLFPAAPVDIPDRGDGFTTAGAILRTLFVQSGQLAIPLQLGPVHPDAVGLWPFYLEWVLAGLVLITIIFLKIKTTNKIVLAGIGIMLLGYLPFLAADHLPNLWADRFNYLPAVGWALTLGYLIDRYVWDHAWLKYLVILGMVFMGLARFDTQQRFRNDYVIWSQATHVAPNSARAYLGTATLNLKSGDLLNATASITQGLKISPKHSGLLALKAQTDCLNGQYAAAYKNYAQAKQATNSDIGRINLQAAGCALRAKHFQRASDYAQAAIDSSPWLAEAHTVLGLSLVGLKRFAEAEAEFRAGVFLDPDRTDLRLALANFLDQVGQHHKAAVEHKKLKSLRSYSEPKLPWENLL